MTLFEENLLLKEKIEIQKQIIETQDKLLNVNKKDIERYEKLVEAYEQYKQIVSDCMEAQGIIIRMNPFNNLYKP